ncbi:MAG: hypothetical protein ACI8RZ_006231 [Myxococcota bacterium]
MFLLLSAPLLAGTPQLYWSPPSLPDGTRVGTTGLAVGDLDADGAPDIAASVILPNGTIGIIMDLSDNEDPFYPFDEFEDITLLVTMVDMDGDGVAELLISLPESDNGNGGLSILNPLPIKNTEDFNGTILLDIDHDTSNAFFGTAFVTADLDDDGMKEILIGAPGSLVNTLYAYTYVPEAEVDYTDYAAAWRGDGNLTGFGTAMLVLPESDEILVAVCAHDYAETDCSSGGGLSRLAMSSWQSGNQELVGKDFLPISDEVPLALLVLPGTDTLIWAGTTEKTFTSLSARSAPLSLTAQGTGVTVTTTPGGQGILWVQDGDTVHAIRTPGAGSGADQAEESFSVDGETLGAILTPAGDLTGDGCEDVLASTAGGGNLYLLPGLCNAITDTGIDTGIDTGPRDTGPLNSGDSGGTDSGEPCEDTLGWTCGGQGSAVLLLTALFAFRRRSGSQS